VVKPKYVIPLLLVSISMIRKIASGKRIVRKNLLRKSRALFLVFIVNS
jgi:hypothetical protein